VELRVGAKKTLSAFRSVVGSPNIFLADKGDLRCTAIKLNNSQVALFSPVQGLGHDAIESLAPLGRVAFLLAPNYYHNKGLAEYGAAFPNACLCAPEAAQPRLKKLTGLSFQGLDGLCGVLPDHMSIIQPDGLKTGEIWVRVLGQKRIAWIVVDAFCGPKALHGDEASEPQLLSTFPRFGIGKAQRYFDWVQHQIDVDNPNLILPCHGALIRDKKLPEKLLALIRRAR